MTEIMSDDDGRTTFDMAFLVAQALVTSPTKASFLKQTVPELMKKVGSKTGGLARQDGGAWVPSFWQGDSSPLPETLIAEAIDQATPQTGDQWCVVPLPRAGKNATASPEPIQGSAMAASALVFQMPPSESADRSWAQATQLMQPFAALLAPSLGRLQTYLHQTRRVEQLTAVLAAAVDWQQLDDDESLLRKIADTATDLLSCERASIFLWNRRRHKLIGRPALGISGDVLEVDDDAGVVGEVLATGEPKIWNSSSDDESRVNRKVDARIEFETRSLVAVPMQGGRGEIIGVFEAINAVEHDFDESDIAVLADLATHAAVAIEALRARKHLTQACNRLVDDAAASTPLIGHHPSIEAVRKNAKKVAGTDLTVLVLGKNGTGKEVLARMIHYESQRRNEPFIAVNCAALVESLLESELFGHEKGAFTDANQTRIGKFELASGGTLFLDEVGDMSPGGQAKLLRVLEEKVVVRVGGSQSIPVDVRVIAATNQPLEDLIRERRFREDLFFRLNVVSMMLPSLADRGDDVLLLADHFLQEFCDQIGRSIPTFDAAAQATLTRHPWPGNIRELRNTIQRVSYLCSNDVVTPDDLMIDGAVGGAAGRPSVEGSMPLGNPITGITLTDATKEFQVEHIGRAIETCDGNMTDAAARLGLHRSNLYRKMRQLGMPTSGE